MNQVNKELKELREHRKQIKNIITDRDYLKLLDQLEQMLLDMKASES